MAHNQREVALPGKFEHDILLCRALINAHREARSLLNLADDERIHLVHSGDLTNSGHEQEFEIGHTFIRSRWCYRRDLITPEGLAGVTNCTAAVPGNHDHMNAQYPFVGAYNPEIMERDFRRTPWSKPSWVSRKGAVNVQAFGLDSNSGLSGTNMRAKGKISEDEFDQLESLLATSDGAGEGYTVKALIVHHSVAYTGGAIDRRAQFMILDDTSRAKLIALAQKYRVTAVLTGHTHDFFGSCPESVMEAEVL